MGAVIIDFNKRLQQKQEEITPEDLDHVESLLPFISADDYIKVAAMPQQEAVKEFKKLLCQAEFKKNKSKMLKGGR